MSITFSIFCLLLVFGQSAISDTFRVALPYIPDLFPKNNQVNIANYIGIHLYSPLIEVQPDGSITSAFLDMTKSRAQSRDFQTFDFCLRSGLKYSNGQEVSIEDLESAISKYHESSSRVPSISRLTILDGRPCLQVHLDKRFPRYFYSFGGMHSTVIPRSQYSQKFPVGIGPYVILEQSETHLKLKHQAGKTPRFETVIFEKFDKDQPYDDTNQIPNYVKDHKTPTGFVAIDAPILKTYALIVNYPAMHDRDCLLSTIDPHALATSYQLNLKPIPGFLPKGTLGYEAKFTAPRCKTKTKQKFDFYLPDLVDATKVISHLQNIFGDQHHKIRVHQVTVKEFARKVFSGESYIAVLGFDSSGSLSSLYSDSSVFFESFFESKRVISERMIKLKTLVRTASTLNDNTKLLAIYKEAHSMLLNSSYVFPLGQYSVNFYYPSSIKEFEWSDFISGFPKIHRLQ